MLLTPSKADTSLNIKLISIHLEAIGKDILCTFVLVYILWFWDD